MSYALVSLTSHERYTSIARRLGAKGRDGVSGATLSQSTHKRVLVRKMNKEVVRGYVNPQTFLKSEGVEILSVTGQVVSLSYKEVKGVHFVRDFEGNPSHLERKVFTSRPKLDGLWLRMKFKDNEVLDGILPNNLLLVGEKGFTVVPPDPYANSQRIYVPKSSLAELTVMGVIGNPLRHPLRQKKRAAVAAQAQIRLFTE